MKLIEPSVEYMPQPEGIEGIYQHIDKCARVCYKSEQNFKMDMSKEFVDRLIKSGHLAMLEHGTVYLREIRVKGADFDLQKYYNNPYSKAHTFYDENYPETLEMLITTNMRVIVENNLQKDLKYLCEPGDGHDKRFTLKFTTDIGIVREILRHRKMSFANESTRYCNYSKDKFDNGIAFIRPTYGLSAVNIDNKTELTFVHSLLDAEQTYMDLIDDGWSAQQARAVLPLATKSEIIVTGFEDDWRHFFDLRLKGTTGKPHPDMKHVAQLALNELESKTDFKYDEKGKT